MLLAIRGFGAGTWAVRNSSTLCFSVLLNRAMGGAHQRKSFTAGEFFLRYPTLCPGLLARLTLATANLADGGAGQEMHPELQPVLVLLSQLSPSPHVRDDLAHLAKFAPPVRMCLAHRNAMVRAMAARALVPFIPAAAAPACIQDTLLGKAAGPLPDREHAFNYNNRTSGLLEATRRLVHYQCSRKDLCADVAESLAAGKDWHHLCRSLATFLPAWAHDARVPPPARLLLLKACGDILWTPSGALQALLPTPAQQRGAAELRAATAAACARLLAEEGWAGCGGAAACPMQEAMLGQAARLLVRQLMSDAAAGAAAGDAAAQERALARVFEEVAAPSYERRWMALRAIKEGLLGRFGVAAPPAGSAARVALQRFLLSCLRHETHLGCLRKLLRCLLELGGAIAPVELCELARPPPGRPPAEAVAAWPQVAALQRSTDPRVRERGLAFAGEVVRCLLQGVVAGGADAGGDAGAWQAAVAGVLDEWLGAVEAAMDEVCPLPPGASGCQCDVRCMLRAAFCALLRLTGAAAPGRRSST